MYKILPCLVYTSIVGYISIAQMAQAETSVNNSTARVSGKSYHQAVSKVDGDIGHQEAKAVKDNAEALDVKAVEDDRTATKHIYKTVGRKSLALYVWKPEGLKADAKAPAIVLFHGGGFMNGNYTQFIEQARYFASRGMVAVSVNYRLISERGVNIEDCIEDAKSAMRWVRDNAAKLGVDPARIASGGGSAGGCLAVATFMFEDINAKTDPPGVSANPNAMILFNPVFVSREGGKPSPRDPAGKGDLKKYVKPKQPLCICFYGSEDPHLTGALPFQEAYKKAGNQCKIVTYKGESHSFFNEDKYRELTLAEADRFLVELGWLSKLPSTP